MCKLFAYVNQEKGLIPVTIGSKIDQALNHLFYINSYKQTDGAGIVKLTKTGITTVLKAPVPSPTLMEFASYNKFKVSMYLNKAVIGHTRYSTVGTNTWENTHPFTEKNFIGVQNGTAGGGCHKTLVEGKVSPRAVDSANVFWAMGEQGVDKTLDAYEGAGVFMYLDTNDNSFNVVKNADRSLFVAKVAKLDVFIFSTDKGALLLSCERSFLEVDWVKPVKDDTLFTYTTHNVTLERPRKVPMYVPPPTPTSNYSGYCGNYTGQNNAKKQLPTQRTSANYNYYDYVTSCDICGAEIRLGELYYADEEDVLCANSVVCSLCVLEAEQKYGRPFVEVQEDG